MDAVPDTSPPSYEIGYFSCTAAELLSRREMRFITSRVREDLYRIHMDSDAFVHTGIAHRAGDQLGGPVVGGGFVTLSGNPFSGFTVALTGRSQSYGREPNHEAARAAFRPLVVAKLREIGIPIQE